MTHPAPPVDFIQICAKHTGDVRASPSLLSLLLYTPVNRVSHCWAWQEVEMMETKREKKKG